MTLRALISDPDLAPSSISHTMPLKVLGCIFLIKCLTRESLQLWCSLTVHARSLQSYSTLCDPIDWSPPGFLSMGLQAKILEWVVMPFSRGSSTPRVWICGSCIAGRFFTTETPWKPSLTVNQIQNSEEADLKTEPLYPTFPELVSDRTRVLSVEKGRQWWGNKVVEENQKAQRERKQKNILNSFKFSEKDLALFEEWFLLAFSELRFLSPLGI